ncbi:hypothetical protein K493DRAFT_383407 [Basidiobolus meristosporus CBS 931.73]|uniref:Extracellular membrane protein CFEM domain-containing protein n=1 Tax=Basidiobolus meristosporus CBS 931.73 TaxID=1314790 RepID=A0A1Y1XTZ8_9FUNG|nr:hypothetical protein K493DRAFT_383407 [Basidiobolus meristosporus CBS 931.73]|eukprot:ORX89193.1 hypothetical protein K493DRAFT_383407 [Basidiobolus meristosporus CBS 931.73]
MKVSLLALSLFFYFMTANAAVSYLPAVPAVGSKCEAADTYNLCRNNAMSAQCMETDFSCHCKQAQNLMQCISFCSRDPSISSIGSSQQQEVTKWCSKVTATPSLISPTATLPNPSSSADPSMNKPSVNPILNASTTLPGASYQTLLAIAFVIIGAYQI